jgi:hypothetical protein
MSEPEGPTWETAKGFTARGVPLWQRQLIGAVSAALLAGVVGVPELGDLRSSAAAGLGGALRELAPQAIGWLVVAVVIRFYIALGWRVVDEVEIDFQTSALRLGQRKVWGRRQRTVPVHDLASVKEVSFGSYEGKPLDWFVFKLKNGDKIRFRCPPGILAMTRRSLQRAGLLNADPLKGIAVQPATAADADPAARRR